jgi:1,4-dihydroxy-2-naphthoate octaprenyltransferase
VFGCIIYILIPKFQTCVWNFVITCSREGVLQVAYLFLLAGFCGLVRVALEVGDIRVTALLTAAIACGYVYQCPPFRLSYKGLGEPLCFVAFGPLATTAFYLAQASKLGALPVTQTIIGASIIVGITTSLILFCSHFHQVKNSCCNPRGAMES